MMDGYASSTQPCKRSRQSKLPVLSSSLFATAHLTLTKLVKMIKRLTAKEVIRRCPHVKQKLWGGEFWSDGYFASTVGKHGDEGMIAKYVKNQGNEYLKLH